MTDLRADPSRRASLRRHSGGSRPGPGSAIVVAVVAIALGATTVVSGSPWPSALAASAAALLSLARRIGWSAAGGSAVFLGLAAAVLALRLGPVVGVEPGVLAVGLWWATTVAASIDVLVGGWPRLAPRTLLRTVTVAIPVVVGLVSIAVVAIAPRAAVVAWATRRDSATNVMFARFILEDGGVDPSRHPNPAYLLQGLVALGAGPGARIDALFWSYEAVWLGGTVLAAAVGAAIVASSVRGPVVALLGGLVAGSFMYSWFVLGLSMSYGFANVPLSIALLGSVLLVARGARHTVMMRVAVLIVGAVLLLASWAPLVVVPAVLGVVALLRALLEVRREQIGAKASTERIRALVRTAPAQLTALLLALVAGAAYAVLVVLPDVRSDGGNLTQNGWFPPMSPVIGLVIGGLVLLLAIARRWLRGREAIATGEGGADWRAVVLVLSGAVAVAGFVALAARSGQPLWTYYPQKLMWILAVTAVPVGVAGALDVARRGFVRVLVAAVAIVGVSLVVLPVQDGPARSDRVPALKVAKGIAPGAEDEAQDVLRVLRSDRPTIAWLYGSTDFDGLINLWSVSAAANSTSDEFRSYAGTPSHDPGQVCRTLEELGPDAVLLTRAENVPAAVRAACPDVSFTVRSEIR